MAATAGNGRRTTDAGESRDRALASVLEARVAHLKGAATRAEKALDDESPDGAAEFAAAAAQHEVARRALDRVD